MQKIKSVMCVPLLIGQRVLVKFMKPGETAGAKRDTSIAGVPANRSMQTPARPYDDFVAVILAERFLSGGPSHA